MTLFLDGLLTRGHQLAVQQLSVLRELRSQFLAVSHADQHCPYYWPTSAIVALKSLDHDRGHVVGVVGASDELPHRVTQPLQDFLS